MADITDAEAIRFVNEFIRPCAEKLRNLKAEIDSGLNTWDARLSAVVGSSVDDDLADGRETEGVSRLTAADVNSFMAKANGFQGLMEQAGVLAAIEKPCVRPLQAS